MRYKIYIFAFLIIGAILGSLTSDRTDLPYPGEQQEGLHLEAAIGFELDGIILPTVPSLLKKCFSNPCLASERSFFFVKSGVQLFRQSFFQSPSFKTFWTSIFIHAP